MDFHESLRELEVNSHIRCHYSCHVTRDLSNDGRNFLWYGGAVERDGPEKLVLQRIVNEVIVE